jgi:hypothetical protein
MCAHCGGRNHKDNRFCTRCGNTLSESAVILDEIEYFKRQPRKDDEIELHEYKSYPTLNIIAEVLKVCGFLAIVAGIILMYIFVLKLFAGYESGYVHDLQLSISISELVITLIGSLSALLIGLFMIAAGESIQLFIDLQENADRQSILLTMLYYQAKAERKVE